MLQFSFYNASLVPESIRHKEAESKAESDGRKQRGGGILVIEPCENVSIQGLPSQLETAGYTLVDAFYQLRQDRNKPNQMYKMVRFVFAQNAYTEHSPEFKELQTTVRRGLQNICETAYWRARAFSNPFYKNGEEIAGLTALSVNFEVRIPRFLPTGEPVVARRKDSEGRKIGEPVPIEPAHRLSIENGTFLLSKC